ncbi:hypothetical protein Enr13x_70840 [Stieleria neptunia]|uniref:Uncharacterized protein n=1 Tax=Stieleria neptunia TaxID=2527979 RepID=A0A518I242_9BACT|nr:hypothetical protein Enr13x_70840 [Stieleria neptunia]
MKPGGLAQCLPVVSATGIESADLLRPGRPAQWVSRSTRSPGIVSARWALSIPLNPPPVADATGRHSTGPPGLRHFALPAYPNPIVGVSDVTINS